MSRTRYALAVAGALAETGGAVAIVLTSNHEPHKVATVALAITAGLSFSLGGLYVYRRRPENRTGVYLAAVGYLWLLGALGDANNDTVWTAGVFLHNLAFIPFALLVLSYPTGQLSHRVDRVIVSVTTWFVVVGTPLSLFFDEQPPACGPSCGKSVIVVYRSHTTAWAIDFGSALFTVALVGFVVVLLARRWRRATVARRRLLRPVYATSGFALVMLLLSNLFGSFSTTAADALSPVFFVAFAAVPFAFGYGVLRSRLARGSVADLVLELGRGRPLRDAIAAALGDPSLELAYSVDNDRRLVDREGRPFALPAPGSRRAATMVEHDEGRVGVIVHDESLLQEPELVESVAATVALALDNERLQAELRSQYELLATIVDTAPSLLVSVDLSGRIVDLNPATATASGFDRGADLRGRYFWDVFIDESEREAMIARFAAAAPEHAPAEYENIFTNAKGEWRVIAWRSAPIRDESGNVVQIVAGGLDVTERKLHEEELRASRGRLVAAADEERRRLERNLHDGAQQRLVSLSVALRLAQARLETDPAGARETLDGAAGELAHALEELRELARGIHPAVLTDRGLDAALRSLAERTPIPVSIVPLDQRLPGAIEAAVYYVVSEAVANVVKHARATSVDVTVAAPNGQVVVEIADDGVGGADVEAGSGLRGLVDRVAVLDGRLRVESPPNAGTRVIAEIPLR